jgi:hypothetical protein
MLHRLAPMTQPNSKLERLLSQRTHTTSCELRNFNDGCFRTLSTCAALHIRICIFASHDNFPFCFLRHSNAPAFWGILRAAVRIVFDTAPLDHLLINLTAAATFVAPSLSAVTVGSSLLLEARSLRFEVVRKGQFRERSPLSKPLVKVSIEAFDQLVDDLEPASPLNVYWSRAIVDDAAFNKLASA